MCKQSTKLSSLCLSEPRCFQEHLLDGQLFEGLSTVKEEAGLLLLTFAILILNSFLVNTFLDI